MTTSDNKLFFKTGMRTLAHTVTSQALNPLSVSSNIQAPILYFEVKVLKLSDKEIGRFGVGFARLAYPYLRIVGSKESVGIRGDGKVFINDNEEKATLVSTAEK